MDFADRKHQRPGAKLLGERYCTCQAEGGGLDEIGTALMRTHAYKNFALAMRLTVRVGVGIGIGLSSVGPL